MIYKNFDFKKFLICDEEFDELSGGTIYKQHK